MVKAMKWQELLPYRPIELTQGEVDELKPIWGLTYLNGDTDRKEMINRDGTASPQMTDADHLDEHDAYIDQDYAGGNTAIFERLSEAISAGHVSIFVKNAGDTAAITIASGDSVQRIQGKDADTTTMPVDVTCQKSKVTFEQFQLSSKLLDIQSAATYNTLNDLYLSAGGQIKVDGANTAIVNLRGDGPTAIPLQIIGNDVTVLNARLLPGASAIATLIDIQVVARLTLTESELSSSGGPAPTDYLIRVSSGAADDCVIANNRFKTQTGVTGALNLVGVRNRVTGNVFDGSGGFSTRLVRLSSSADISTIVALNVFRGPSTSDIVFECASADADAAGLILLGNVFRTAKILGSQDAQWLGNDLAGCTIDFQSKTGIIVIGGDMTGATLQNIPSDIVFFGVKGQDNRGNPGWNDNAKILLGTGNDAELYYDGTDLQVNARAVGSGDMVLKGDLRTQANDTYHLGAPGTNFKNLYLSGNMQGGATISMHLKPTSHGSLDLGGEGLAEWRNIFAQNYRMPAAAELTIATGAITVAQSHHTIDTESDAATDDLNTISGLAANQWYLLRPANGARTVVLKHGVDNILCFGNADITLDDIHDFVWVFSPAGTNAYVMGGGLEETYVTHIAQFPALAEDLATGVMGARPGLAVGESGEHGTFAAIRAKAIAGTAGTGTTTILIEADNNPAFSSATTLFTLALNTATEVDDTGLDNTWATGDIFIRARCSAVGATAPKDVNVTFYFKERAENF